MGVSFDEAPFWPIVVVNLLMALIMAYIYPKGYEGGSPTAEGLRFGILLGLFVAIPFGLFMSRLFSIALGHPLVGIIVYTIEVTTAGLLIGLVYGRREAAE